MLPIIGAPFVLPIIGAPFVLHIIGAPVVLPIVGAPFVLPIIGAPFVLRHCTPNPWDSAHLTHGIVPRYQVNNICQSRVLG